MHQLRAGTQHLGHRRPRGRHPLAPQFDSISLPKPVCHGLQLTTEVNHVSVLGNGQRTTAAFNHPLQAYFHIGPAHLGSPHTKSSSVNRDAVLVGIGMIEPVCIPLLAVDRAAHGNPSLPHKSLPPVKSHQSPDIAAKNQLTAMHQGHSGRTPALGAIGIKEGTIDRRHHFRIKESLKFLSFAGRAGHHSRIHFTQVDPNNRANLALHKTLLDAGLSQSQAPQQEQTDHPTPPGHRQGFSTKPKIYSHPQRPGPGQPGSGGEENPDGTSTTRVYPTGAPGQWSGWFSVTPTSPDSFLRA